MPIFTREESLLVWIHERRELESRQMPMLAALISRGWVTATPSGDGSFTDVALTLKGQEAVSEVISRD